MKQLLYIFVLFALAFGEKEQLQNTLKKHVIYITENIGARPAGSVGDKQIQNYLISQFTGFGLTTHLQKIDTEVVDGTEIVVSSANVIATVVGKDTSKSIIIGAHHDTVDDTVVGANDNGTGLAVMLALAEYYSKNKPPVTIHFVGFAAEEADLAGSKYFVNHFSDIKSVKAMINLDMLGEKELIVSSGSDGVDYWIVEFLQNHVEKGSVVFHNSYFLGAKQLGQVSSDYGSFLEKDIPSIGFSSRIIPSRYHSSNDIESYVEYTNLINSYNVTKRLIPYIDKTTKFSTSSDYYVVHIPFSDIHFLIADTITLFNIGILLLVVLLFIRIKELRNPFNGLKTVLKIFSSVIPLLIFVLVFVFSESVLSLTIADQLYWINTQINVLVFSLSLGLVSAAFSFMYLKRFIVSVQSYFRTISVFLIYTLTIVTAFISLQLSLSILLSFIVLSLISESFSKWINWLFIGVSGAILYQIIPMDMYSFIPVDTFFEVTNDIAFVALIFVLAPYYFMFLSFQNSSAPTRAIYTTVTYVVLFGICGYNFYLIQMHTNESTESHGIYNVYVDYKDSIDVKNTTYLTTNHLSYEKALKQSGLNHIQTILGDQWNTFQIKENYKLVKVDKSIRTIKSDSLKKNLDVSISIQLELSTPYIELTYFSVDKDLNPESVVSLHSKKIIQFSRQYFDTTRVLLANNKLLGVNIQSRTSKSFLALKTNNNQQISSYINSNKIIL